MNKLYEMIDNNLSIIRKRTLYNWYYEDIDIRNIISYIDDFQNYVFFDKSLEDIKSRYLNIEMDYRNVIDWIDDIQSKMRFIMEIQNKKEEKTENNELEELKENLNTIYNKIAELYDMIEEWEIDYWTIDWTSFILEELANIQNYAK